MKSDLLVLLSCSLLIIITGEAQGQTYGIATFNIRGIRGNIRFTPVANSNSMTIRVNITGTNMDHTWHVHTLPVDSSLPPQLRCSNDYIGGHYDPLLAVQTLGDDYSTYCSPSNQTACEIGDLSGKVGRLTSGIAVYTDTTGDLTLFGRYGIIGRSIKIHGMEDVCATIVSSNEVSGNSVVMLQSSFTFPVGGTIYMRQVEGDPAVMFGKLYWVTDSMTTNNHNWHVHMNQPSQFYREGSCQDIGGHFNPFGADTSAPEYSNCGPDNLTACEVGDLSRKHGQVTISSRPATYAQYSFLYQDSFLNLTGVNAVIERSIAVHSNTGNTPVIACAPLIEVETLSLRTYSGMFSASQSSRFSQTLLTTSYSASNLFVFDAAIAPNSLCMETFSSGRSRIYNPHDAPPFDGSDNTPDRYPVGEFSRKYNFMTSENRVTELPVHGYETIAGHSLGNADRSASSTQYTCSSLWPMYPSGANVRMARATFNSTVTGGIYFVQRNFGEGVYGSTYIFVDIWYTNSSRSLTYGHNWHIHESPPRLGERCVNAIGGHFNPFNVNNDSSSQNYMTECSPFFPLRCESGDLSGKHPRLNISSRSPSRPTYTYTDPNLHLWGNFSIIGRSVGLHLPAAEGGALFDCGAIEEVVAGSRLVNFIFDYDANFDRTDFATRVTEGVNGASPSDLLMVRQVMTTGQSGTSCVNMTVRVLGSSVADANAKINSLESQFNNNYSCSGSVMTALPSLLLMLGLFLLTAAAVFGQQ